MVIPNFHLLQARYYNVAKAFSKIVYNEPKPIVTNAEIGIENAIQNNKFNLYPFSVLLLLSVWSYHTAKNVVEILP